MSDIKKLGDHIVKILDEFIIEKVDYICLQPGYTSRLMYPFEEKGKVTCPNLINSIKISDHEKNDYYQRNGFGLHQPIIYSVVNPQFKFWQLNQWNDDGESNERNLNAKIEDCPRYQEELDFEELDLDDFQPHSIPIMIYDSDIYIFDKEAENIIKSFDVRKELYGSIVFKPAYPKSQQFELNDWLELAKLIDIDFCACYSPTYPYQQKIIRKNGITLLIVVFEKIYRGCSRCWCN